FFSSITGFLLRQARGFDSDFSPWPRRGRGRIRFCERTDATGDSGPVVTAEVEALPSPGASREAHRPGSGTSRFGHSQDGLFKSRLEAMGNIIAAFALGMTFALAVTSGADLVREGDREWIVWLCVFAPLALISFAVQLIDYRKKQRRRALTEGAPRE